GSGGGACAYPPSARRRRTGARNPSSGSRDHFRRPAHLHTAGRDPDSDLVSHLWPKASRKAFGPTPGRVDAGRNLLIGNQRKNLMLRSISAALLSALIASRAMAQSQQKGVTGGDVVVMGGHPIEFVSKGEEIAFHILEDDGKSPTSTKGFAGRAVIQDGGKTFAVNLSPAEPNMFVGQLPMPLGS